MRSGQGFRGFSLSMDTRVRQHSSSDDIGSHILSLQAQHHIVLLVELIDCLNNSS